jgi:hypothetical protein
MYKITGVFLVLIAVVIFLIFKVQIVKFLDHNKKVNSKYTLVIGILKKQSSFSKNISEPANNSSFDTVQWVLTPETDIMITTYALDHDVHSYKVQDNKQESGKLEFAEKNINKNYGDILQEIKVLNFENYKNEEVVKQVFIKNNMNPNIQIDEDGFFFWNPDNIKYETKSTPEWIDKNNKVNNL